jgi:hypothetical protein
VPNYGTSAGVHMEEQRVVTDTVLEVQNGFIDVNLIIKRIEDRLRKTVFIQEVKEDGKACS